MEFAQIGAIAGKEFRDRIRNRWVLAEAVVCSILDPFVVAHGAAAQGSVGVHTTDATTATRVSLATHLDPVDPPPLGVVAM